MRRRPSPAALVLTVCVLLATGCASSVPATKATGPSSRAAAQTPDSTSTALLAPTTATPSTTARPVTAPPTTAPPAATPPATAAPPATTRAAPPPPATAPPTVAPAPPYPLTTSTLVFVDRSRPTVSHGVTVASSRTLTTLVWAPAEPGRWPLLVFAHGYQVGPTPYLTLLETWAAQGYVVAAPEFPLTDLALAGTHLDENDLAQQPADVRYVIDQLVGPGGALAARIDPSRVGVAGHSDGAETALAVSAEPTPAGEPGIRSVIAMSVSPLDGVTHTANPPILVTQGDADTTNLPTWGVQTWQEANSPKYLGILHGAGHLPPLEAGSAWFPAITATTEAFLRTYLAGTGASSAIVAAGTDPPLMSISSG